MWEVGWRMIRERPFTGVGAGRVAQLYTSYLSPGAPVPAYHGHLHNNALQLAAQFGLPVLLAALCCCAVLLRDLAQRCRQADGRDSRFVCRAALMGAAGFLLTGMTDYTYGHALGLILSSFVVLSPLLRPGAGPHQPTHAQTDMDKKVHAAEVRGMVLPGVSPVPDFGQGPQQNLEVEFYRTVAHQRQVQIAALLVGQPAASHGLPKARETGFDM